MCLYFKILGYTREIGRKYITKTVWEKKNVQKKSVL